MKSERSGQSPFLWTAEPVSVDEVPGLTDTQRIMLKEWILGGAELTRLGKLGSDNYKLRWEELGMHGIYNLNVGWSVRITGAGFSVVESVVENALERDRDPSG